MSFRDELKAAFRKKSVWASAIISGIAGLCLGYLTVHGWPF